MADPNEFDHVMPDLENMTPKPPETLEENIFHRVFFMILIAIMISLSKTLLTLMSLLQLVFVVLGKGKPNERLAELGTDFGIWMAKAIRYQTAASEVKPWPWTELD
jgi:succinate-acetate transporter protein